MKRILPATLIILGALLVKAIASASLHDRSNQYKVPEIGGCTPISCKVNHNIISEPFLEY
jgi:hypothetical protein